MSAAIRRRGGMLAVVACLWQSIPAAQAYNSYWLNPNGGNWSDGSNWSNGNTDYFSVFSLDAATPYTVTNTVIAYSVTVANDQVILDLAGQKEEPGIYAGAVNVSSVAGQNSSLTLSNAGGMKRGRS